MSAYHFVLNASYLSHGLVLGNDLNKNTYSPPPFNKKTLQYEQLAGLVRVSG